jgi:hypothetical protein
MKIRKHKLSRVISTIILISMMFVLLNTVSNGHIHKLANGRLLFHAHPYQRTSDNNTQHHHTKFEFIFYYFITHLFKCLLFVVFWLFVKGVEHIKILLSLTAPNSIFIHIPLSRAPPHVAVTP